MPDPIHDPTPARPPDPDGDAGRVLAYHEASKHHRHAYAPAPAALDWANQPDPFRTFAGAPAVELPLLADALRTTYAGLYDPAPAAPKRADVNSVGILFELALGLSAWKEHGAARWALRCNPSSGNLHPTEGYAVLPDLPGIGGGVYHYAPRDNALELRRALAPAESTALAAALPPGCLLVGLSSVHWREAWKYGARAFRYCQHDAGHALAAVRYAAAALGWAARLLDHAGDAAVAAWLGLDADGFTAGELGRAVRIANNRAAAPVKAAVVAHSESIKRFGFLAKSHRIKLRLYGDKLVAVIGPSTKYARTKGKFKRGRRAGQPRKHVPAMVAHLVEKGTARSKPKPFLRPALDAEGPRFLRAVPEQVGREIDSILSRKV